MKFHALFVSIVFVLVTGQAADSPEKKLTTSQRLEPEHLKAAHEARQRFERERQAVPANGVYEDFRAVMHVHAEDSNHTGGTRAQVLEGAQKAGVRIVMFTDHRGPKTNTWHGLRDGVLFFAGSEEEGLIRFPGFDAEHKQTKEGELRFLCHVEERYDAPSAGFDGMEICNRHTDAKLDTEMHQYVLAATNNPERWSKLVEGFKAYPDEFFAAGNGHWPDIFAKWDRETQQRKFTGVAANDAHQNQVFQGTMFDPYEVSFRNLCTHILARELTETAVRQSLREGHVYVSHDWLCDPTGFAFVAANNLGVFEMGDPVPLTGTTRIAAQTPVSAHLKLFHQSKLLDETNGTRLTFVAKEPGAYRAEAWLAVDGEERPWIYANPIYLETPSLASLKLPSNDLAPNVELKKDIAYTAGKPEDENKHKLDIYLPKDRKLAPVFVFIHGGAWKSGDRSRYVPIGNRFAKEGIVTVAMSYRLAPKDPHPAQIEDVAAAFAWVVRHIAEYGGDTNRIYVGGHSAGGHLAALLTLDGRYLKAYDLSARNIRGTVALSGVYNLAIGESQSSVFGTDEQVRKEASPLFHVKAAAPPFLVTYCQWDYLTLPAQAKIFYASLRKAGVEADLFFTPREGHISEVLALVQDDDPTAKAVLKFIR